MSFVIHGLGTAHPPEYLTPEQGLGVARFMAGPDVRTSTWLGPVYANSGNNRRYLVIAGGVVQDILNGTRHTNSPFIPTAANDGVGPTTGERMRVYAEFAGPLALRAAIEAMTEAKFHGEEITHLVTVSCTGFLAPGVDLALISGLRLRSTIQRTHVGFMGCHGAMNGLRVANAFATADSNARVLVAAVELCSLHYYYGNTADKLVANAIFADGAAAVVGKGEEPNPPTPFPKKEGGARVGFGFSPSPLGGGVGEGSCLRLIASGSCVIPDSTTDMAWTVGDHGFEMTLSRRVPGFIAKHLRPWLETWLSDNGLSLGDVRSWAVHPGGPKIVSAVEESLGLTTADLAASRGVFADHGNMSSPTVLFVLDRLRQQNAPRPCVALGFGPGLVAEAALFV
ncbi:MAG: type III polyketide synthase [Planctomycetes bacterium]|nr:type III polyketide synthase [Planctomycetota bacterium]